MGWGGGDVLEWDPTHFGMKVLRREAILSVNDSLQTYRYNEHQKKKRLILKPACLLWPRVKIKTKRIYTYHYQDRMSCRLQVD